MNKSLTWIEISKSALQHQVRLFKNVVGQSQLQLVIKSNAYGHGIEQVVSAVGSMGEVDGFMVASLQEALALRSLTKKPIAILSFWEKDRALVARAIRSSITFPVYNSIDAQWLARLGRSIQRKVRVNVKIDVGTNRLGFRFDSNLEEIRKILKTQQLAVRGIFSHFASSENSDESFTKKQEKRFAEVIGTLVAEGYDIPEKHIACSAAALRNPDYHYNVVRIGVSLYGLWPSMDIFDLVHQKRKFKQALSWKTRVIHIKELKKGDGVGYGSTWKAPRRTTIAVLPVGYWDGYDRKLSNSGEVLINGKRCKVRGNVCMNVTMVEVSRDHVSLGDIVTLIGSDKREIITAADLAKQIGTIHYEVVTRINPLIPRYTVK